MATHTRPVSDQQEMDRQRQQAEELLFSGPGRAGFVKALFRGEFRSSALWPYPALTVPELQQASDAASRVADFARDHIDAASIDREADIPADVIRGLGDLGVLGMCAPVEFGGQAFSQRAYCKVLEVIGGHCASTAVFVNAHHSIGLRALVLFGTEDQKARWLGPLARGEKLAAFALTEKEAGSDAANVQTTATPSDDGRTYILNGTKRYITNGGIADVLTVMARTPDASGQSKVTAFLVTPDLPGFRVVNARMEKCGIRGTATAELAFDGVPVPAGNVLGPLGKGLKVALTVLDYGRTTFGATCTGAAKACLAASARHASRRRQFGRELGSFELVKRKIASIAAHAYAMEATTTATAAIIDTGADDYMLETAILKVFATESLWDAVYETLQVHGGQGYFTDEPYERWMRDARINQIGEGANEVLLSFIALVGLRDMALDLQGTAESIWSPTRAVPRLWRLAREHTGRLMSPDVPVASPSLRGPAVGLARAIKAFGWAVEGQIVRHREALLEKQYIHERLARSAIALYAASCTLARLDASLVDGTATPLDRAAGTLFVQQAIRRVRGSLGELGTAEDALTTRVADLALGVLAE